jgi:hypothetical protein
MVEHHSAITDRHTGSILLLTAIKTPWVDYPRRQQDTTLPIANTLKKRRKSAIDLLSVGRD